MYTQISQGPDASAFHSSYQKRVARNHAWGTRSTSWWITLLLALGIIFLGTRFIVMPETGADGFGISFVNPTDDVYGKIKGIRDIFSGLVLLPLLWKRMRTATALVFTAAIIVPVTDGLIVLTTNGLHDVQHLLIHWGTAAVMVATSLLLFQKTSDRSNS